MIVHGTLTQVLLAEKFEYIGASTAKEILELIEEIVKMLATIIKNKQ